MSLSTAIVGPNRGLNPLASFSITEEQAKALAADYRKGSEGGEKKYIVYVAKSPAVSEGADLKANRFFSEAGIIDVYFKTFIQASAVALVFSPASAVWQKFNDWSLQGRSLTSPLYLFKTASDLYRCGGKEIKAYFDFTAAASLNAKIWGNFFFESKNPLVGRVLTVATFASDVCEVKEQVGKFLHFGKLMEVDALKGDATSMKALRESRNVAAAKALSYATAVLVGVVAIAAFSSSRFSDQSALLSANSVKMWELGGTLIKFAALGYEKSRENAVYKDPFLEEVKA